MRRLFLGLAVTTMMVFMSAEARADDQQIANRILKGLQTAKQQGKLKGFQVDLKVQDGTVWFSGFVSNPSQEQTVFKIAQTAKELGLVQIVDDIEIRQTSVVAQASPVIQTAYLPQQAAAPTSAVPAPSVMAQNIQAAPATQMGNAAHMNTGAPVPMGAMQGGGPAMSDQPHMPNYAWPSYAAHPNYGAVTYPRQYSAGAWPYIGPFHPYPQVPMGWRKVQLEWNDGWWQLDFKTR